ncbi:hypothetical protein DMH02_002855 [Streptomyces sp. WAC 00631]|uniref:hypothetical protein n=1 Tax=Streptomyces sp. WAC 00631 TaxID=2203201 RepID=UPI000F795197|nr:hypothetical protein [Streptomyces sp. WAC 00631]MCC5032225.1 hypothetical protein [Streptomyces sp. WAC 00631]
MTDLQHGADGPERPDRSHNAPRPEEPEPSGSPESADRTDGPAEEPCGSSGVEELLKALRATGATGAPESGAEPESPEDTGTRGDRPEPSGGPDGSDSSDGSDGRGGPDAAEPDSAMDEEALRRLLRTVVEDIEPSRDSLDHLRHAVPARRARKRQALVGAVAAVLLVGTAVPGLLRVADSGTTDEDQRANAASSQRTQGGADGTGGDSAADEADERKPGKAAEKDGGKDAEGGGESERDRQRNSSGASAGATPSQGMAASSPSCERTQLGSGTAVKGEPDSESKIYGSFRLVNVSDTTCTVSGPGLVTAAPQGTAENIQVVDHTLGDAATGLPDPAADTQKLILEPGQAYEVRFAWVPAEGGAGGCPTPGTSPEPETSDSPSGDGTMSDGGNQTMGAPTEEEPPPSGSVLLTHIPEAGEPAASTVTIGNVCAGTVYRTGVIAG